MSINTINLGSTSTNSSGQSVISTGLASGLDTTTTINSIVAAQSSQITTLGDQVTVNNSQASALTNLQSLLTTLQATVSPLADPSNPDSTDNLWAAVTGTVTSNTSQAASNYLTASVAPGTAAGSYTISNITALAQATVQQSQTFSVASADTAIVDATATSGAITAGTITFTDGATVTLSAGDTLNDVAQDFNNVTSTTGITASVLETSTGNYSLIFTGTQTGLANGFDLTNTTSFNGKYTIASGGDPNSVLSSIGGTNGISTSVNAQDAVFELNGVQIDRASNTVSDLVSGVTFNLLQNTNELTGASFNVTVAPDTSSIQQGIDAFASAYNNFLTFYAQQTALNTSGTPASSAVLYNDTTLRNIYNQVSQQVSGIVSGLGTNAIDNLSDVGITLGDTAATSTTPEVSNTLTVDDTTLASVLQSNFSGVEHIFGSNISSSSSDLLLYQSPTNNTVQNFTLNIDQTDSPPTYTGTYTASSGQQETVNFTGSSISTGGVILTADSSSALAGLQLIWGISSNTPTGGLSVTLTQGIAGAINTVLTNALTANTGLIALDQAAIASSTTSINTQIASVKTQVANTRTMLTAKYAALEQAIDSANSALNYLNAQQLANSSSSG